jgi:drug/metabolite transporter (DMT)-like permease
MLGMALALCSSLCWGVADFIGGVQSRRSAVLRVVLLSQGAGLVVLIGVLAVQGHGAPALHRLLPAAAGGVAGVAALAAFYQGLSIGTMSIVAPIAATGVSVPVVVGIAGGDHPAAIQLVGIAAAVIGVALASRERDPAGGLRRAARASVGLALLAALGFGCFFIGLRASARADPLWATFAARTASVIALSLVALRVRPALLRQGGTRLLVLAGTLDVSANVLFAVATRHGLLSVVSVLSSLYPLATVALARLVLGERVRRIQEVGVLAALTGVLLIAAG